MRRKRVKCLLNDRNTIESIRIELKKKENTTLTVSVKTARKNRVNIQGIMYATYPNIFIISVKKNETVRQHSFNYCDIIAGKIKVEDSEEQAEACEPICLG